MMNLFVLQILNLESAQQRFLIKIPKLVRLRDDDLVVWEGGSPQESKSKGGKKLETATKKTENIHSEDVIIHHSLSPWLALPGSHYHIIVSFTK